MAHTAPSSGGANRSCEITPGQSLLDGEVGARASKKPQLTAILVTAFWTLCALAHRQPWQRAFQWLPDAELIFRHDALFCTFFTSFSKEHAMNSIVYLVGAVVIIIAVLSFFGLR